MSLRAVFSTARAVAAAAPFAAIVAVAAAVLLAGCSTLSSWLPSIPAPSFSWLWGGDTKKPGPLPDLKATVTAQIAWQAPIGKAVPGFAPTVVGDSVYVAATDGAIMRVDARTGRSVWRIAAGKKLSAGAGADATMVAVGTDKGDVLAFDADGKPLWQAKVSSEVVSPPRVAEGTVVIWSGDGRVFGLSGADGKTKWVYQRISPPLTVRNYAGGWISRGGLLMGTAGGKLVALDLATGNVAWEANVATPKGATELERIADVTSLPVIEERQVCAVAYQGRVACFELVRGTLNWSRDVSSLDGIVADSRYLYVVDDKGSVLALDKATGASAWKQDKLAKRRIGGPQLVGDQVGVVDGEGYLHLLDRNDGSLVGRLATDGSPATAQPSVASPGVALWQSETGTMYAVGAR
jgi:outer membrane protein assembly factor BamB